MQTYDEPRDITEVKDDPVCECGTAVPQEAQACRDCMVDAHTAQALAGIFRALADPTRLRIISALAEREYCVSDLIAALGMEQPAVSHQLRAMRAMHLVRSRKEGRHVFYQLDDEHIRDLFIEGLAHVSHP